jgi:pimeloyl-ACP methyl ester carboxylesterase
MAGCNENGAIDRSGRGRAILIVATVCLIVTGGCRGLISGTRWIEPRIPAPAARQAIFSPTSSARLDWGAVDRVCFRLDSPAVVAATIYAQANELHRRGQPECVDAYFRACLAAESGCSIANLVAIEETQLAWRTYHDALTALIALGQHYGRLDPRRGLFIASAGGWRVIPVRHHGFAWRADDFDQLLVVGRYASSSLTRHYQSPGIGVPLVALRIASGDEAFHRPAQPFAATALLRSPPAIDGDSAALGAAADATVAIDLFNPHIFDQAALGGEQRAIVRDLTAPLAYLAKETPRRYLEGFLLPDVAEVESQLVMLEPYQPGKIPVVFIHGLLSDPTTWLNAVNELRSHGDLYARYQFWFFRYPTGDQFLRSAADLREQLEVARRTFDPCGEDPAMRHLLLVGHSMGGLVARLQVANSGDILWRQVSRQPLSTLVATAEQREMLRRSLFFEANPAVSRVVFIATPHAGSSYANRPVGRLGASLVRVSQQRDHKYEHLIANNPHAFSPEIGGGLPTSIDLLEPSSHILAGIGQLPVRPCVRLHSIIGTGRLLVGEGPSDGVVPVSSAQIRGVASDRFVEAQHSEILSKPETLDELHRLLWEHADELRGS